MESKIVEIYFKYVGYSKCTPRTNRRKYVCCRQKIIREMFDKSSMKDLGKIIGHFYPNVIGQHLKLTNVVHYLTQKSTNQLKLRKHSPSCLILWRVPNYIWTIVIKGVPRRYAEQGAARHAVDAPWLTRAIKVYWSAHLRDEAQNASSVCLSETGFF